MLKMWNIQLVLATFLLCIFATFLTRSGLIESVHSFATNLPIAFIFLGFMSVLTLVSAGLVYWRREKLQPDSHMESFLSREAAFIANNLLFVAAMFAVLWGTLFPLISEGFLGQKIAVGPPFFNRVTIPIGLILLGLMGIGPVIAWRKASSRNLRRNFAVPLAAGLVTGAAFWVAGVRHVQVILTFALGAFTMATIVNEFRKGTRARSVIEGEGVGRAFVHLIQRNRRRYGGYIVHAGLVVMFMGFAGAAYDVEVQASLAPGESMEIRSPFGHTYNLTYQDMSWYTATNMTKLVSSMQVERDGRRLGILTAEQRSFRQREELNIEVGVRRAWNEDLYVILAGIDDPNGIIQGTNTRPMATFRVLVNPLVPWIWLGGVVMSLGTLIALWPGAQPGGVPAEGLRRAAPQPARREEELAGV